MFSSLEAPQDATPITDEVIVNGCCCSEVLGTMGTLRLFFSDMWLSGKLVAAELIFNSVHDPFTKLYYYFLNWILPKFTTFNKYFQSNKPVITVLHEK